MHTYNLSNGDKMEAETPFPVVKIIIGIITEYIGIIYEDMSNTCVRKILKQSWRHKNRIDGMVHTLFGIGKLSILSISILPKLIYKYNVLTIKIFSCFLSSINLLQVRRGKKEILKKRKLGGGQGSYQYYLGITP